MSLLKIPIFVPPLVGGVLIYCIMSRRKNYFHCPLEMCPYEPNSLICAWYLRAADKCHALRARCLQRKSCFAELRRLYDTLDAARRVYHLAVYSSNKRTHRLQRHFPKKQRLGKIVSVKLFLVSLYRYSGP